MQLTTGIAAIGLALCVALAGCGNGTAFGGPTKERYNRKKAQKSLGKFENPGIVIGEFTLARNAVVDGDTIRVDGLDTSLRLLAIDTEEKFRIKGDRRQYEMGWEYYTKAKRGDSVKPAKYASPMGEEATKFAKKWFKGVTRVRLERDHPKDMRGRYGRYLSYVIAYKDGKWQNYNVECVRAGMSPYFMKYGYSRRFHDEFVAAQNEARAAKRGIWDPTKQHYPDYDERLAWWTARAEFVKRFEADAAGKDNFIVLGHWDSLTKLEANVGKEVEVLSTIGQIRLGQGRAPHRVMLSRRIGSDFPLIYFDKDMFGASGVSRWKGEFVRARGTVTKYYNKYRKTHQLQIVVELPSQVVGPTLPWFDDANESGGQP